MIWLTQIGQLARHFINETIVICVNFSPVRWTAVIVTGGGVTTLERHKIKDRQLGRR